MLEANIRSLEGFEIFRTTPSGQEIMALARKEVIVCFNVLLLASHAMIVSSDKVLSYSLPNLRHDHAKAIRDRLIGPHRAKTGTESSKRAR